MKANSQLRIDGNAPQNLVDVAAGTVAGREATISEMARAYGVTSRTLRFYEDRKLLRPRRAGSARYYGDADHARLATILKGKQLGFTLTEIADSPTTARPRATSRNGCSRPRSSTSFAFSSASGVTSTRGSRS